MRPPIRLLHVTVGLGLGGAEKIMAQLAAGVDRGRFHVEVLALKEMGPTGELLKAQGIPVTALGGKGVWDVTVFRRARSFFRSRSPEIIHAHLLWAGLAVSLMKGPHKFIWHEHDTLQWMGFGHRLCHRRVIEKADKVVAVSRAVGSELSQAHKHLRNRLIVVPNSLSHASQAFPSGRSSADVRKTLEIPSGVPIVGWVGRMEEPKKGLSVLLDAAKGILSTFPDTHFIFVGDGPARQTLQQKLSLHPWRSQFHFVGTQREVGAYFELFDVLAVPSLWEGFGLVTLEAMCAGKPVVASNVGGIPEVVEDGETGYLVPPGDPHALSLALKRVLQEKEVASKMGEKGRERVMDRYSLDVYLKKFENIYEDLVNTQ